MYHLDNSSLLREFGGSEVNNLNNLINQPDAGDDYDFSTISQYVTLKHLPKYIPNVPDQISVVTLNCQSLHAKFDQLHAVIHDLDVNHSFKFSVMINQ